MFEGSETHPVELRQKQFYSSRFQESWYPEGIDPNRQTFLKRSLRNHSFYPNRTFLAKSTKTDMLIPRLYGQATNRSGQQHSRRLASDLQRLVKEGQFNVLEQDFEVAQPEVREGDLIFKRKEDETVVAAESLLCCPGLTQSGKFYTVLTKTKRTKRQDSPVSQVKKN